MATSLSLQYDDDNGLSNSGLDNESAEKGGGDSGGPACDPLGRGGTGGGSSTLNLTVLIVGTVETVGSAVSKVFSASLAGVWGMGRREGTLRGFSGNGGFAASLLVLGLGEVGGVVTDCCRRD